MESLRLTLGIGFLLFSFTNSIPTANDRASYNPQPEWSLDSRLINPQIQNLDTNRQDTVGCDQIVLEPGQTVIIDDRNEVRCCLRSFQVTSRDSTLSVDCSRFALKSCEKSNVTFYGMGLSRAVCGVKDPFSFETADNHLQVFYRANAKRVNGYTCSVTASVPTTTTTTTSTTTTSTSTSTSTTTTATPTCFCGKRNDNTRVIGGNEAEALEYPWQVGLVPFLGFVPYCGGAIICDRFILTAAHCVYDVFGNVKQNVYVVVGEHDYLSLFDTTIRRQIESSKIILHPDYQHGSFENDIALVELKTPIDFNLDNQIAPICLPDPDNNYDDVEAVVTGWGKKENGLQSWKLQEITVSTISNTACHEYYSSTEVTSDMICTHGTGNTPCQYDDGGPLMSDSIATQFMELIGLVSFGNGCTGPVEPWVYTRVSNYLPWININTATCRFCSRP